MNPARKLRLPHVFGTDNRLLPYSTASARGTLLIQQFPMHNDRNSSSSSTNHHGHHPHDHYGDDNGGHGHQHNSLLQGLAAGYADLTQDFHRNKAKGSKSGSGGSGRKNGNSAGSGQDWSSFDDPAPSPPGTSASLASAGGGERNSSSGAGWLGKSSSHSPAAAAVGFWTKERELVLLVESFRRGPGRQLLVCVTTHRVVCAEGARSGGELALSLEWAMPVRRVEPLLR